MWSWNRWITDNWQALCAKRKLCVREGWLEHPRYVAEFRQIQGWPKDQTCDWARAMNDGSRVHVQCYAAPDGTPMLCIHRDRWDPDRGIGNALMHLAFETPAGAVLGVGAAALAVVAMASEG